MSSILDQIVERKREEVAAARRDTPLSRLEERVADADPTRDFFGALRGDAADAETRVIAEIKRRSPSAGVIWTQAGPFDPAMIARSYHAAGATAISCLTDEAGFGGDLGFIAPIREAVPLPVLRKDFMIDPYQVWEARAAGADAILLIAECLELDAMIEMRDLALELGMSTLLEVHDEENFVAAVRNIDLGPGRRTLLGINNRDLARMRTDLANTERLVAAHADALPDRSILVGESGIGVPDDLARLRACGVNIVLVGESLMREADPGRALGRLLSR